MSKNDLIAEIEAYAASKTSGNELLIIRAAQMLKHLLDQLPEKLLQPTVFDLPLAEHKEP